MIDDPDGKHAEEWYPMDQFATASGVGTYPMSKKKRIALLEKQVADLQARILRLEGWPVAFPGTHTCTPPHTPTTDGTGSPPVDLTPRVTC